MKRKERFKSNACIVFTDEQGRHQIMTPNGEIIRGVISTKTIDTFDDFPQCEITMIVNLVSNIKEAKELLKESDPTLV